MGIKINNTTSSGRLKISGNTGGFKVSNLGLISDGLLLYYDAGNINSYPGSGNTWFDISGNSNNGTLINSPTYSTDNGGSIVFDGVDDYVQYTGITISTACVWGIIDTGADGDLRCLVGAGASIDGALRIENGSFRSSPDPNDFHFNNTSRLMINGVSNLPNNGNSFIVPNGRSLTQNFYVGAIITPRVASTISHIFLGRVLKGKISVVALYNRQLSNEELLQNYNYQKSRFGL
jgi:hypothetical protein